MASSSALREVRDMYTPEAYVGLIEAMKSHGYRFAVFEETVRDKEKIVYLRHDVDYSPRWAAEFACLNEHCGVIGTFCFQLRGSAYNLASAETQRHVEDIIGRGQCVALHFAFVSSPAGDLAEIAHLVRSDLDIAVSFVPAMKPFFSWHNPSLVPNLIERTLDLDVPGLANLYGRRYFCDTIYRSDSNWRYTLEEWGELICIGHKRIQLLFHPYLWMPRGRDLEEVLSRTFAETARGAESELMRNPVFRKLHPV